MKNYIAKIRQKIGQDKFIHPAVRVIVENAESQILFVEKRNSGQLGIPAGALEEDETIEECAKREVMEETGLEVISLQLIGISSLPECETVTYANGDVIQYFVIEFWCKNWKGKISINDTEEIQKACFKDAKYLMTLPDNEKAIIHSLRYFREKHLPLIR